jgi:hypothetical protein
VLSVCLRYSCINANTNISEYTKKRKDVVELSRFVTHGRVRRRSCGVGELICIHGALNDTFKSITTEMDHFFSCPTTSSCYYIVQLVRNLLSESSARTLLDQVSPSRRVLGAMVSLTAPAFTSIALNRSCNAELPAVRYGSSAFSQSLTRKFYPPSRLAFPPHQFNLSNVGRGLILQH